MNSLPTYAEGVLQAVFSDANLPNIQQHEWEMRTFLQLVVDELKPARTVELGTYRGFTGALLSQVTSTQTVSIDVQDYGTADAGKFGNCLTYLLDDATTPECVTHVMAMLGGPIDLLFIDDGHYYEQIVKEFELWEPLVRHGGWIVFHDINPLANIGPHGVQPDCVQVTRFWNELKGTKQEIIATAEHAAFKGVIPHGGLGILRV
jgi:predicted O-methyltransferase YrrM